MLDPIPIIFFLTALVGIVVLISRHLPELEATKAHPQPSWVKNFTWSGFLEAIFSAFMVSVRYIYKAFKFAKSEMHNSYDLAKHFSGSLKHKLRKRQTEVKVTEKQESNGGSAHFAELEKLRLFFE